MEKKFFDSVERDWDDVYNEPCSYYSIQHIISEAENGNADFQCVLGYCYNDGEGVERNYEKAFEWFKKAAEQGHAQAQFCVADSYLCGTGVDENYTKAMEWMAKAAENDNFYAHNYFNERSEKTIDIEYVRESAENGDILAQYELGKFYDCCGAYNKAFKWLKSAAEQGHLDAQCKVAECYANGDGVEKDEIMAFEWYMKAAERGNAEAQYCLFELYSDGTGCVQDDDKADEYLIKSAENGCIEAQHCLASYYQKVSEDKMAFNWLKKAAVQGSDYAQYKLAECYYNGKGVEQSSEKAFLWYSMAADSGHKEALQALAEKY